MLAHHAKLPLYSFVTSHASHTFLPTPIPFRTITILSNSKDAVVLYRPAISDSKLFPNSPLSEIATIDSTTPMALEILIDQNLALTPCYHH
jgi:hypothetical protein